MSKYGGEGCGLGKDARLLARPILQEYDASTVELATRPAEFGNLVGRTTKYSLATVILTRFRRPRSLKWESNHQFCGKIPLKLEGNVVQN
jgi:hypothetical protein